MIQESNDFLALRDRYNNENISITSDKIFGEIPIPLLIGKSGKATGISYSFIDQVLKYFYDLMEYMDIPLYRLISKSVCESYKKFVEEELKSEDIKYLNMYISFYDCDDKDLEDDLLDKDELIRNIKATLIKKVFLGNDYLKYYYREGKFEFDYETIPDYILKNGDELWRICSKMNDLYSRFNYCEDVKEYLDNRPNTREDCMKESLFYHYFPEDGIVKQYKDVCPSVIKSLKIIDKIANNPKWILTFNIDYLKDMSEFDYLIFLDLLRYILIDYKRINSKFMI